KIPNRGAAEFDDAGRDDPEHGGLENVERIINLRQAPVLNIEPTEKDHDRRARHNKREAGENGAEHFSLKIADVNRELQRFGAGQHVAEGHDLHESIPRKPATLLDHVIEHHRDLRDRAAHVDEAENQKIQKYLAPRRQLMIWVVVRLWRAAFLLV